MRRTRILAIVLCFALPSSLPVRVIAQDLHPQHDASVSLSAASLSALNLSSLNVSFPTPQPETSDRGVAPFFAGTVTEMAGVQGPGLEMWEGVVSLQTDQKVEIRLEAGRPTVKGKLVAADSGTITVVSNGTRQTLQREDVRRVRAIRKGRERFQLFGILTMAAGGGIALGTARGAANDLSEGRYSGQGQIVLPLILIGTGAVIGTLGTYRPVYERRQP